MSHAGRIVKILLEDGPKIRGEYWIIDGDVAFADGDVNHVDYAMDHAKRQVLSFFQLDDDQEFDEQEFAESIVSALREEGIQCDTVNWFAAASNYIQQSGGDEKMLQTLNASMDRGGDVRDIAMKYWGWKWCRGNNIATHTFTTHDRQQIVHGLNEIVTQEGNEDENWDEVEITIGVGATGKRYAMTLAELESGRSVSQDPTWGNMREDDQSSMMNYMEPEIERITTRRMFRPEEEVSNGTLNTVHLCRRGLDKLRELDYGGWQLFLDRNKEELAVLERVERSHEGGEDFDGDVVTAHEYVDQIWEYIQNVLASYCPLGYSFGSHQGNASLIGCWKDEYD